MSIYVVTHKPYDFPTDTFYKPIQVGGRFNDELLCDSLGENIALKNKNFCELTALFWLWKNTNDDVIGLVHYRRYFKGLNSDLKFKSLDIVSKSEVESILKGHDLIAPTLSSSKVPLFVDWSRYHNVIDWLNVGAIIKRLYPEYIGSFISVSESHEMHLYNMCIMKNELMHGYCSWLFDILFEYESKVCLTELSDYQSRLFGFLSERLFNVWLHHNQLSVCELDVINVEMLDSHLEKRSTIRRLLSSLRYKFTRDVKGRYLYHKFKKSIAI